MNQHKAAIISKLVNAVAYESNTSISEKYNPGDAEIANQIAATRPTAMRIWRPRLKLMISAINETNPKPQTIKNAFICLRSLNSL